LNKVESTEFLWGAIHEGFFSKMFLSSSENSQSAYQQILRSLKRMVKYDKTHNQVPGEYQLIVTGHSLGGALATMFYSRLLKSPGDLSVIDANIRFTGGYNYGAPRIGSFLFSRSVAGEVKLPLNRFTHLYRVKDANDMIPRYPFGSDNVHTAFLSGSNNPQDIFDYSHVGTMVYLQRFSSRVVAPKQVKIETWEGVVQFVMDMFGIRRVGLYIINFALSWYHIFDHLDPINIFCSILPIMGDHFPCRYYLNLENATDGRDRIPPKRQKGDMPDQLQPQPQL